MSAIERLSLTKNFLFISALDKDYMIFCNSRFDFGFKTALDILLRF